MTPDLDFNSAVQLRYAEPHEREALTELQRRTALATGDYREQILAYPDAIEIPTSVFVEKRARVVVKENRVVGFSVLLPAGNGFAELDGLFVEPELFGNAFGRALVQDAFSIARDQGITRMEVTANPRAIGFYEKLGFLGDAVVQTRFAPGLRMHASLTNNGPSPGNMELITGRLRLLRLYLRDCEQFRADPALCLEKLNLSMTEGFPNFLQPQTKDADMAIHWDGFWMIYREERKLIGGCGCRKFPNEQGEVEIAYGLAPEFQNKGLATEAATALKQHAFRRPEVKTVTALTLPQFNASTRVLTKCGFVQSGTAIDEDEGQVWKWTCSRE